MTIMGIVAKIKPYKYNSNGRRTRLNAIEIGVSSTNNMDNMDIKAAVFNLMLENGPILNKDRWERILYDWNTWDNDNTRKVIV